MFYDLSLSDGLALLEQDEVGIARCPMQERYIGWLQAGGKCRGQTERAGGKPMLSELRARLIGQVAASPSGAWVYDKSKWNGRHCTCVLGGELL